MNLEDCLGLSKLNDKRKREIRAAARTLSKTGVDEIEAARSGVAQTTKNVMDEVESLRDELAIRGHRVDRISTDLAKPIVKKGGAPRADVEEITKHLAEKGIITEPTVVQAFVDLPNNVITASRGLTNQTLGIQHEGKTYIIADNIDSWEAAYETALHEDFHRGVTVIASGVLGGNAKKAANEVAKVLDKIYEINKDAADQYMKDRPEFGLSPERIEDRRFAAEEVLAERAGSGQGGYWYDRLVAAVRKLLRRIGEYFGKTLEWTDAETRAFIQRAHRASRRAARKMGKNTVIIRESPDDAAGERLSQAFHSMRNPMTRLTEDQRSFALQVHGQYDRGAFSVNVKLKGLQDKVMALAGLKHAAPAAKRLDMAMLIYRDLKNSDAAHVDPAKRMPMAQRVADFKAWAAAELPKLKGHAKLEMQEFLRDLDQALALTPEQKQFVDDTMNREFASTTAVFVANGKLKSGGNEHYVYRKLTPPDDRPTETSGAPGEGSGPVKSHSSALMRRKYPTLLDAFQDGYRLAPEVRGITNSWKEVTLDALKIEATKRFLQDGMSIGVFSTKNPGDWVPLKSPSLQVWRPVGAHKTVIRDTPHISDVLAAKTDTVGSYTKRVFVTQPEANWAVYGSQSSRRASGLFDNEADARLFAQQFQDPRVEYRENTDVFGKVPVYAPEPVAAAINAMTAHGGELFNLPVLKGLAYLNGTLKPWMLWGDFFHHQSLMRSWTFGGPHDIIGSLFFGGAQLDPQGRPTSSVDRSATGRLLGFVRGLRDSVSWRKAMLSGLELVEQKNPVIMRLVEKGLTFPTMASMTGHDMTRAMGIFETLIRALGSQSAADIVKAGQILRQRSEHWLFGTLDAGLKAQWAYTYFMHQLRHELARGGTPNADQIAEVVADAANTAFGGQHAARAGRNKDLGKLMHILALAPDWALTQIKPAFVATPGMPKLLANIFKEMPPPPGQASFYRRLIAKQILAALIATVLAQVLINGGSDEGPWELYREQMSDLRTASRLRWAMVDVTRMYHSINAMREGLGMEPIEMEPGTRMMFNLPGFIIAPLRLFELGRFVMSKGSPVVRIIAPYITGEDWRGRPYKTVGELGTSLAHPDRKASPSLVMGPRDVNPQSILQWPAIFMANVRDAQPQQIGQMLRWLQGEEDGLSAALRGLGMDVAKARDPRVEYERFREIQKLSREEFGEMRRDIFKKDFDPHKLRDSDIDAYVAVGMRKALRMVDMKAAQIRTAIEEAKLNPDYTARSRQMRIRLLKETEESMYRNVNLHYRAYTEGLRRHSIRVTGEQLEQIRKELQEE